MATLESLAVALLSGETTAQDLTESCLENAETGEGPRVFISVDREAALCAAKAADAQRKAGVHPSPFAGIPISVKDLFDIRGQVTKAGSRALEAHPPATVDAPAIANLRKAGFVIIGRTNMTEFAYSGLGLNPHYGTPANPWDREQRRIPGGSSSGAAVSVTDGMAYAGIGSDTGGSCRIPAALCGIVGYKPTQINVSLEGVMPLSGSLDSIGSMGCSPRCVEILDAVMSGIMPQERQAFPLKGLRLLAPTNCVLDNIDAKVAGDFEATLSKLSAKGAVIDCRSLEPLDRLSNINAKGGFAASEALHWHRALMADSAAAYDPRVIIRIRKGESQSALDYITLMQERRRFIKDVTTKYRGYGAIVMPTVPILAPRIVDLAENDQLYGETNLLMLRNPSVFNFLDGCAISLPMHKEGTAPTGLMIGSLHGHDAPLFSIAHTLFEVL